MKLEKKLPFTFMYVFLPHTLKGVGKAEERKGYHRVRQCVFKDIRILGNLDIWTSNMKP